jgi:hypothetical protein
MDFSSINWLAVIASVVASMIIGSVWFGPKGFYPAWQKALGQIDKNEPNDQNMVRSLEYLALLSSHPLYRRPL